MLQRIQSVWMLLAAICAALTFKFSFYSGNKVVDVTGHRFTEVNASSGVLILILTAVIVGGCLVNIFNYKQRKKQVWLAVGILVLSLVDIFLFWRASGVPPFVEGRYSLTAFLPLAVPFFLILALRGILRDQKLVKNADRLR